MSFVHAIKITNRDGTSAVGSNNLRKIMEDLDHDYLKPSPFVNGKEALPLPHHRPQFFPLLDIE